MITLLLPGPCPQVEKGPDDNHYIEEGLQAIAMAQGIRLLSRQLHAHRGLFLVDAQQLQLQLCGIRCASMQRKPSHVIRHGGFSTCLPKAMWSTGLLGAFSIAIAIRRLFDKRFLYFLSGRASDTVSERLHRFMEWFNCPDFILLSTCFTAV